MALHKDDVKYIANLAKLELTDAEIEKFLPQLQGILEKAQMLQEVNTEGVPEMSGGGENALRLRKDEVTDGNLREEILSNAPQQAFGCFVVPKVVE